MTTPPQLVDLRNALLSNTLSTDQQTILVEALDAVTPFVAEPATLVISGDQRPQDNWISAIYAIMGLAAGGGGMGSFAASISVANLAALEAFAPITTFPDGSQAYTKTFGGARWSLEPLQALVPGEVVPSSDASRVWVRTGSADPSAAAAQLAWFIDPANASGHASDENTGLDAAHPLLTKREIFRRYGFTWTATYDAVHCVITYISSDDGSGNDPGQFAPVILNGAIFEQVGQLPPPAFTGTLLAFTALNTATNTIQSSTFTTTTGAVAVGMLLVNTTRGNSEALAYRDSGGGNWILCQPFDPFDPTGGRTAPNFAWANGDAILGYNMLEIDQAIIGGLLSVYNAAAGGHVAHRMHLIDPPGPGDLDPLVVVGQVSPLLANLWCERALSWSGGAFEFPGTSQNCMWAAPALAEGPSSALLQIAGGAFGTGSAGIGNELRGGTFENTAILASNTLAEDVTFFDTFIDGATTSLVIQGNCTVEVAALFGPGRLIVRQGVLRYGGSAVTSLPQTGGKHIGDLLTANAYSNAGGVGTTTVHQVATITSALLDAAAGAAGYGGLAFIPGVGAITNSATP